MKNCKVILAKMVIMQENVQLKNLFLQNLEILRALRNNSLSSSPISFFFHKIIFYV